MRSIKVTPAMVRRSPSNRGVSALAVLPNGDLVAGGEFDIAGGVSANKIARWDGTAWYGMGIVQDGGSSRAITPAADVRHNDPRPRAHVCEHFNNSSLWLDRVGWGG